MTVASLRPIQEGEFVAVFLGRGVIPTAPFSTHPQVVWLDTHNRAYMDLIPQVAPSTRAFVLTNGIEQATYSKLATYARDHNLAYVHRRDENGVRHQLYALLPKVEQQRRSHVLPLGPPTPEPAPMTKTIVKKGALKEFLDAQTLDLEGPRIVEARRLLALAEHAGLKTTEASLAQALTVRAREAGKPMRGQGGKGRPPKDPVKVRVEYEEPLPPPVVPTRQTYDDPGRLPKAKTKATTRKASRVSVNGNWGHGVVSALNEAIRGLERLRETVTKLADENDHLKKKIEPLIKLGLRI